MSVLTKVQKRKKHEKVGRTTSQPVERTSAATSWYLGPPVETYGQHCFNSSSREYKRSSASAALLPSSASRFGGSERFERYVTTIIIHCTSKDWRYMLCAKYLAKRCLWHAHGLHACRSGSTIACGGFCSMQSCGNTTSWG